jgi:hypothetical protein
VSRGVVVVALVLGLVGAACGASVVPREPRVITVSEVTGSEMALEIVDETGDLVDAAAVGRAALGTVARPLEDAIAAEAGAAPNQIRIVWISWACETSGRMTISDAGRITIAPGPADGCDAIPNYRAVDLAFRGPVNVPALELELLPIEGMEKG